ncbi:MAG TPA: 2-succinyl-5-enolpyruvyl-6-hydroxy-3-cyclohexene-1-carboxylic-acid synthase, partial [Solirubrobacteraceae bacterium]
NGAGQAIDQLKLYGDAAKWFFEVGVDRADEQRLRWMRTLACRAYWTALEGRPGVVHLNFPLREPLVSEGELPPDETGRPNGLPYVHRAPAFRGSPAAASALGALVAGARRGVLVAGRHERGTPLGQAAAAFAAAAGWPLLADPLSGARRGDAAIAHYDVLLRDDRFLAGVTPDLVLRVGDLPVSKPLRTWLAGLAGVRQVALDPEAAWQDPAAVLSDSLPLEPASTLARLAGSLAEPSALQPSAEEDWLALWRSADERASEAILGELGDHRISEPAVAGELGVLLPEQATLFVASSMPVRDIETFWPVRADPPRVLCNRGANGIDGTVSSAFGAAAEETGPVVLLIGDVALAYDIGGLLARRRLGLKLTIVLLNNGGGGIFDFLAVAGSPIARAPEPPPVATEPGEDQDIYTRHIATPTGLDFAAAGALYGLSHERVEDVFAFRAALEASLAGTREASIIEVGTSREENVGLHGRLWEAVSRALSPPGAGAAPTA